MEKQQAIRLILETLKVRFNRDQYRLFLDNLLPNIVRRETHYNKNFVPDAFKQHIRQYWRIGKYIDLNEAEMDLLIVETEGASKLEQARASLRAFALNRLRTFKKECALIAFYGHDDEGIDWRFSFVKRDILFEKNKQGKVVMVEKATPARRYSYLVGESESCHTAQTRFLPLLIRQTLRPSVAEIEQTFGVERVDDDFFAAYKQLFLRLCDHLKTQPLFAADSERDATVARFAKKMLGQIVFLYFLQKKGWLGVPRDQAWGTGNRQFLSDLFNRPPGQHAEFYRDHLAWLFYEALSRDQGQDGYYPRFDCRVPFLNGGLFESEYTQAQWPSIPDIIFRNKAYTPDGDEAPGILDIFDLYNFTVNEDDPLEKTVAIDPEMLGKVFERMLEIEDRKDKGSYYTPREVVHYMCQESLIQHLYGRLQVDKCDGLPGRDDLELFIRSGFITLDHDRHANLGETGTYQLKLPETIRKHASLLDQWLADIKICDPAIGSGAFPVGMLLEIVQARKVLATYLPEKSATDYELKLHAIGNSIYGVDIDASAVDIARLRLWLSLIVEENNYDEVKALPNLDFKIVCNNSLLGVPATLPPLALMRGLTQKKANFFSATDELEKKRLRKEIEADHEKFFIYAAGFNYQNINFEFKLCFYDVWQLNDGFDLVIGNPPYLRIQSMSDERKKEQLEQQGYDTFSLKGDLYCLFYEKGFQILRPGGALCLITSNKWMQTGYGKALRQFFLNKIDLRKFVDFGESHIFSEAVTYTNILLGVKGPQQEETLAYDLSRHYKSKQALEEMLVPQRQGFPYFREDAFSIADLAQVKVKERIDAIGLPLQSLGISIFYGLKTGFNEGFIIDSETRERLLLQDPNCQGLLKPMLRGKNIKRYHRDAVSEWLINTHNGYGDIPAVDVEQYPVLKMHLEHMEAQRSSGALGQRQKKDKGLFARSDMGKTPYNLRNCAYVPEFAKEKIIWQEMAPHPSFTISTDEVFILNTSFMLIGQNLWSILAVLNSQVMDFYFPFIAPDVRGKTRRYFKQYVEALPIPPDFSVDFEPLCRYAIFLRQCGEKIQTGYIEQIIDALVYELYFPGDLEKAGKIISPHLGDLPLLDDGMSDEEKTATIKAQFDRLYDPNHPVRYNLYTLDSIEVVRTIRQALKK